jgi:hypothetical protein
MMKGPSNNFFVQVSVKDSLTGKPCYGLDGERLKHRERMMNGKFRDSTEQEFYFLEGHELAGQFFGNGENP